MATFHLLFGYLLLCTVYEKINIPYHTIPYHTIPYHTISYHVPQRFQISCHILGGQLVSAHSPWFQTEPLGPPGVCVSCSPFLRSFDRHGFFRRRCWSQAELKTLLACIQRAHLVGCGQLRHLGVVAWEIACIVQPVICKAPWDHGSHGCQVYLIASSLPP